MTDDLTQAEADVLFTMHKRRMSEDTLLLPALGGKLSADLASLDGRERFLLDVNRSYVSFLKVTYQTRARVTLILARLDLDGAPHRNPDDTEILCPHLHLYKEGYGDKWAYPLSGNDFGDTRDRWRTLNDFMAFCQIVEPPYFERGLFW